MVTTAITARRRITWTANRNIGSAGPTQGPVRLDPVELSPPGRHSKPLSAPPNPLPRSTTTTDASAHPVAEDRSPTRESQAEALWAIAAALERLADVVATYLASPQHDNGMH
jgi:hypothetical protein